MAWPGLKRWILVLLLQAAVAASVAAHAPVYPDKPPANSGNAAWIEDHTVSRVYYSVSDASAPETWFAFDAAAGDVIHFSMGVPYLERLEEFAPLLAFGGPGVDEGCVRRVELGDLVDPSQVTRATTLRESPASADFVTFVRFGEARVFQEHVTGTTSWILVEADVVAPETGRYYLVAFQAPGTERDGKLFLTIGTKERFPLRDVFGFFRIRRFVREFHELR
jgi:hypothetical protein